MSDAPPTPATETRRLAAVVFTDVVGYSARMQRDERTTIALVQADFDRMRMLCAEHEGEILNTMGDGMLMCFGSAVQAVSCALQIQSEFGARKAELPEEQALAHRIGVHIGDVFRTEEGQVAGDGVNIAARLEGKAPVGGICLSQMVYDTVQGKVAMQARYIGPTSFKNIAQPIPIWHALPENEAVSPTAAASNQPDRAQRPESKRWIAGVISGFLVLGIAGGWYWTHRDAAADKVTTKTDGAPLATASIAVLPFVNMSSDKEQEYFSDGLSEELLNLLAQLPQLRVIARTSSFSFKGKETDIATIAKALNVSTVLEGSVRKSGDTVRITAQLIRASDSSHLWSETYDRKVTDVLKVQDEIAGAVVTALKVKLLPAQKMNNQRASANTEAYSQYLLGNQFSNRLSRDSYHRAAETYKKAIALAPDYAAAYAGLAAAEFNESQFVEELPDQREKRQLAVVAAEKAIALAPELADGYLARAWIRLFSWDWAGAKADFSKALMLDPGDSRVQRGYAAYFQIIGRMEEAIAETKKAIELDPLSAAAWSNLGGQLFFNGQLKEARNAVNRALSISPEANFPKQVLVRIELLEKRPQEALLLSRQLGGSFGLFGTAMAEHSLGHAKASQQALDELIAKYAQTVPGVIGAAYAWRGENDRAFEWIERAIAQRDIGAVGIKFNPLFAALRNDARYRATVQKLGLPD